MYPDIILEEIKTTLLQKGETISVAESVTSGMIQNAFSTAADAIYYYQGGITCYNIGQKARHLQLDPIRLLASNCVSHKIAAGMAANACRLFSSDWGMGITGYASPVPESGHKQFAFAAICHHKDILFSTKIDFNGKPFEAQLFYTHEVLKALNHTLMGN